MLALQSAKMHPPRSSPCWSRGCGLYGRPVALGRHYGRGSAILQQLSSNFNFLIRDGSNVSLKSLVSGERNFDAMISRGDQHSSTRTLKLADVANKESVQENCGPRRMNGDLDCRRHHRKWARSGLLHGYANHFLLSRLEN